MIEELREKIGRGEYEFSQHALDASILRRIAVSEIREAVSSGEVIEDYPENKYGPSCLVYGLTSVGKTRARSLHPSNQAVGSGHHDL